MGQGHGALNTPRPAVRSDRNHNSMRKVALITSDFWNRPPLLKTRHCRPHVLQVLLTEEGQGLFLGFEVEGGFEVGTRRPVGTALPD